MSNTTLLETGSSTQNYYKSINNTYKKLYAKLLMLHYPFFEKDDETLEDRQVNLTKYCVSQLEKIENQNVLEVCCGNGTQSIFIYENYQPAKMTGVDINSNNIELANSINGAHQSLNFMVDDAQQLNNVPDNSVDILLCIESAFHYPHKEKFMRQAKRVLKPSGKFLIADILSRSYKNRFFLEKWKRRMSLYHWTKEHYFQTFEKNGLKVKYTKDITEEIKKGYRGYSRWVSRKNFNSLLNYLTFRLFIFAQVKINTFLLKKRRRYFIFIGEPLSN